MVEVDDIVRVDHVTGHETRDVEQSDDDNDDNDNGGGESVSTPSFKRRRIQDV